MGFNFPDIPTDGQVYSGYVWNAAKGAWEVQGAAASGAVRYDIAQGLNAAQQSQARANIDVTQKNYIINGAMMVSQQNGTTAGTVTAAGYHPADQFMAVAVGTTAAIGAAQAAVAGTGYVAYANISTADASVAAGDNVYFTQHLEGLRVADLKFGSADAKTVTIQFGCKGPAGTYCVTLSNGANNRAYVAEYVIGAGEANQPVVRSVTIPGDTTGTWPTDNTRAMTVRWGLMCGTTFQQAAGSWGTVATANGSPNQFNFAGTAGNIFWLFDVSLTEGTVAPPFVVPDYASELVTCQRYFQKMTNVVFGSYQAAGNGFYDTITLSGGGMRAAPTAALSSLLYGNASGATTYQTTPQSVVLTAAITTTGYGFANIGELTMNARL